MNEFLSNSQVVLKNIKKLEDIIKEMEDTILIKQTTVLNDEKDELLEKKITKLDFDFNVISETISKEIKRNQKETEKLKNKIDARELEVRQNHIFKHTKELKEAISEYRNLKCTYKNKEMEMMRKTFEVTHPGGDEEAFEKYKETLDSGGANAFTTGSETSMASLKHAQMRKERLDKVVEVINRLVTLIEEIDELVHKNSKVIDEIVVNIADAEVNATEANKQLESALYYQRRSNKIKRILYGIMIVFLCIGLWWLVPKVLPNNK